MHALPRQLFDRDQGWDAFACTGDPSKLGGSEGSEVFSEAKGINLFRNKTLRIRWG
jgi:hypothetical protein